MTGLWRKAKALAFVLAVAFAGLLHTGGALSQTVWKPLCFPDQNGKCGGSLIITIQANTNNVSLPVLMQAQGWDGSSAAKVQVTVMSGVVVGSTAHTTPAFDTGILPAGSTLKFTNNGIIAGKGGDGGGGAGGPALSIRYPTTLANNGTIGGGGGGGGRGAFLGYMASTPSCTDDGYGGNVSCNDYAFDSSGGGGGGGAGGVPGVGSGTNGGSNLCGGNGYSPSAGAAGSTTTGGTGGSGTVNPCPWGGGAQGPRGGNGGSLGQPGSAGMTTWAYLASGLKHRVTHANASAGGAAGPATTAGSAANITWNPMGTVHGAIQ